MRGIIEWALILYTGELWLDKSGLIEIWTVERAEYRTWGITAIIWGYNQKAEERGTESQKIRRVKKLRELLPKERSKKWENKKKWIDGRLCKLELFGFLSDS